MQYRFLYASLTVAAAATAAAIPAPRPLVVRALSGIYTITAYKPGDTKFDGGKIESAGGLNVFQEQVAQYCPTDVSACPNGTESVFAGSLGPICEVPGGQDTYVTAEGQVRITVQHSHEKPLDAYWAYEGFSWTELPASAPSYGCPSSDPTYNCDPPTGYLTWQLPNVTQGGIFACPNTYNASILSIYAATPGFNRTDCTELTGLGTHNYTGPNPPVWSYV